MKISVFSRSRYGDYRYLIDLGDGSYLIDGKSLYCRSGGLTPEEAATYGTSKTSLGLFDFEGGPCLLLGAVFQLDSLDKDLQPKSLQITGIEMQESDCSGWAAVKLTTKEADVARE